MKRLFVSGIGTDVGKTLISAILVEKMEADYWKPIQTGADTDSDTLTVKSLITNTRSQFFQESVSLKKPVSPHEAAALEGVEIRLAQLIAPVTENNLIIEGAGGLMVPINDRQMMADLVEYFDAELILVCKHYLGSINHTLLSLELIKQRKLNFKGIIFTGSQNLASESFILNYSGVKKLGYIPELDTINPSRIKQSVNHIHF